MSLEKAIENNTAAVLKLCGLIEQEIAGNQAVREVIAGAATKVAETVVEKPAEEKKADIKPEPETKTEKTDSATSSEPSPEASLKYCQDLALRLFNEKGREICVDTLSRFGVAKASLLQPAQYPDFIAHAIAVLAGAPV